MSDTIRYYIGDPRDLDGLLREEVKEKTVERLAETEELADELIDEIYPPVELLGVEYDYSAVLYRVDTIAYDQLVQELVAEVNLEDYLDEEVEEDDDE